MTVPNLADCKAAFAGQPLPPETALCELCGIRFEAPTQAEVRAQIEAHAAEQSNPSAHMGEPW